ncbi:MAG: response regulator transcription factor [Anaerolineales bacterium]|nr:response regulator transcription factor [Anaerolineales bacterium]
MKRILVIEDDLGIVKLVREYLERAGYEALAASDGAAGLARAVSDSPDLVVLDLGLPGMDGLDVARELRRRSQVPLIMLTARGEEADRIVGLELGADDYVVKPFSPKELVARVRSVLRRVDASGNAAAEQVHRALDVSLDISRMRTLRGDQVIDLTAAEFQLLLVLVRQPGRIFTRAQLLEALHGVAFESYERAIDTHIKNLRRKLEPDPHQPRYVLTVYGVGYRFADE